MLRIVKRSPSLRGCRPFRSLGLRMSSTVSPTAKNSSSLTPLLLASFIIGAGTAYLFPLSEISKLFISSLPLPGTVEATEYQNSLETQLKSLELYKELASSADWVEQRAWTYMDSNALGQSMTTGTLAVPGAFAIKPVLFFNYKTQQTLAIVHVGARLCGYPFLVHGGILATILDELLKRGSSFLFDIDPVQSYTPDKIKTDHIELQYRSPTLANSFLVVRAQCEDGRVKGDIETLKGRLLVRGVGDFSRSKKIKLKLF